MFGLFKNLKSIADNKPALLRQGLILLLCTLFSLFFSGWIYVHVTCPTSNLPPADPPLPPSIQPSQHQLPQRSTTKISATLPTLWPVSGPVTSGFGWRKSPLTAGNEFHPGIDIACLLGTPVVATADGLVTQSGGAGGYGNMVEIDHGNGLTTIYGHNSQVIVTVGQAVKKGDLISYSGSSGESTGPHVHYEVRENGVAINPGKYLSF